jgi:hypothetical protein
MKTNLILIFALLNVVPIFGGETPGNRIASIFISESFINEQLALHRKSEMFQNLSISFDPEKSQLFLHGVLQMPIEELRAINFDPAMGRFRFQVTILPRTTKQGHLILEFPLDETFFYPADSKNLKRDRVIIPVQMLSLGLASARGYLAAISGDFSGFDRRREKLEALVKALERSIRGEKNPDALDTLITQRDSLKLQLQAVPLERKQLQSLSKEVVAMLGFAGEKEIKLNDELAANRNALILKIKLSQLAPYLDGIELGGVRVVHDKKDGHGENYLAVDIDSELAIPVPAASVNKPSTRTGMKNAPLIVIRLNQSLLESETVVKAEKKSMTPKLKDFLINLKNDGLHVSGSWSTFLFSVPFDTIVDFVSTKPDVFEVRMREIKVFGLDFDFLSKFALESLKNRLDKSLKNICTFDYLGEEKDRSTALRVTVNPARLIPAIPDLHVVEVEVREGEFLLKIGKP